MVSWYLIDRALLLVDLGVEQVADNALGFMLPATLLARTAPTCEYVSISSRRYPVPAITAEVDRSSAPFRQR
jgi:hypothetical protein